MRTFEIAIATGLTTLLLSLWGCGGAQEGSTFGPSEGDDVMTSSAKGSGSSKTAALPKDAQADAASKYCEHVIEKAGTQPPDNLDRKTIQACLTAVRPQMKANCSKGVEREVVLKIVVEKAGTVSDAFAIGDGADSPEATCIAEIVKAVKFPQFKGAAQQVIKKYPFKI